MPEKSHDCKALVIRCMDHRLNNGLGTLLAELELTNPDQYDLVSLAGSAKGLLAPWYRPWDRWILLRQIGLAHRLHRITQVVILLHDNCGAYGIADADKENRQQRIDLAKIDRLLKKKFPQVEIICDIVTGTKTGELELY